MNRYQQEVAEMDRRHRVTVRALSFGGAVCLAVLAMWSAGLPLQQWWSSFGARAVPDREESLPEVSKPASPGTSGATAAPVHADSGNDSSVVATPQRLHLVSTTPGRTLHEGVAQIGTNPANPQTYVAGAILVNGARLAEIHSDHVVLERGKERLSLFVASARGAAELPSSDLAMVRATSKGSSSPTAPLGVDKFGEVIRAMPYYENDMLQGLQVAPGRKAATFAQLGLKPADIIVAVDSVAVTDPQNALEYLQSLTQGAAISVRVRRGSATQTLSLDGTLIQ
jgi:hypothetical protein